jgi:lycopene beta-cyclase
MSYALFLATFVGIPLALLALAAWLDSRRRPLPKAWSNLSIGLALGIHVFLAVAYTTPWDNYLVATGVWYYDPALVWGVTIGWVPLEEYTFFVVQTLAAGLWLLFLARRLPQPAPFRAAESDPLLSNWSLRRGVTLGLGFLWMASIAILFSGWVDGTYLGLILVWALPPIMLQTAFGADLLWRKRLPVGLALATATLYLSAADSLAINAGTWTIAPEQSTNLLLGGVLPFEEFLFFLITNTLVIFGTTLVLDPISANRGQALLERWNKHVASRFYSHRKSDQELPGR